jgi:hypothetical protein
VQRVLKLNLMPEQTVAHSTPKKNHRVSLEANQSCLECLRLVVDGDLARPEHEDPQQGARLILFLLRPEPKGQ